MRFTVVWLPDALRQLAEIWNTATDRSAVVHASDRIDVLLRFDPETKGIDFYGDRLIVVSPLQVIFRVRFDDMLVEVLQVS